jgi:ribosomal protein L37AE/L43A
MKSTFAITGSLLAALVADAAGLSRQDLEKKLQALDKAPAPTKLAPGAMCYKPAGPQERQEYTCPTCGEKTLYSRSSGNGWTIVSALSSTDSYRRLIKQLQEKGMDCRLDESAFCQKCGKNAQEKAFILETKCQETGKPHRASLASPDDLELLLDFLANKDRHDAGPGGEKPLKDYVPRLRALLGIDPVKAEEKKP